MTAATPKPLRLMVYDRTCTGGTAWPGLSRAWGSGGWLYRGLGRIDAHFGATTWPEALQWLATYESRRPVAEIQYWGHGKWGHALMDGAPMGADALEPGHALHDDLAEIRSRLVSGDALWWFRTCEQFGADAGHHFARAWTEFFACRTAGHTFIIGRWQSGLHSLRPGQIPYWSAEEGLESGSAAEPVAALWSGRREPNTITFLHGSIPRGY